LKLKRRHFLKRSEVKELGRRLSELFGTHPPLEGLEVAVTEGRTEVFFRSGQPVLIREGGRLFPTVKALLNGLFSLPKVVVDMGAVPYVTRGADVMLPGIRSVDETVRRGSIVVVVDETHGKPLAVGESLLDADEILAGGKGRAVKNLHWVGDKYWHLK